MSTTLSYGYKLPSTNDSGSTFFPDLEDDIQQVNDHDHDGANSAPIASTSISVSSVSITAAGWASVGGGLYRQSVTVPNSKLLANVYPVCRNSTTGDILMLQVEKNTTTAAWVYTNDNTIDVKVDFLT